MKDDYKIQGPVSELKVELEREVVEVLKAMETHSKIPCSELANTAIKRFISAHKDFLPNGYKPGK